MFSKLTAFLDSFVRDGAPGYDCLILQNGREIYRHQGGYTDVERRIPVSGNERYNLYSCSKPITVTAALMLLEEGLYTLEDPLYAILPEFREMSVVEGDTVRKAKNPIRMRDLFAMTAGFDYNVESPALLQARKDTEGRCPTREVMRYLAREPLSFEPGTRWQYSLCHDVLAAATEVLAGERFGDFVARRIFRPLGMSRSTFLMHENNPDTVTEQYCLDEKTGLAKNCGKSIFPYKMGSEYESGGAGCVSTVEDYMRFLEGLRDGSLLRPETLKLMYTDCLNENTRPHFWHNKRYGYALGVRCPLPGGATDFGWDGAAGSYLAIEPTLGLSIFYATHMRRHPIEGPRLQIIDIVKEAVS